MKNSIKFVTKSVAILPVIKQKMLALVQNSLFSSKKSSKKIAKQKDFNPSQSESSALLKEIDFKEDNE